MKKRDKKQERNMEVTGIVSSPEPGVKGFFRSVEYGFGGML